MFLRNGGEPNKGEVDTHGNFKNKNKGKHATLCTSNKQQKPEVNRWRFAQVNSSVLFKDTSRILRYLSLVIKRKFCFKGIQPVDVFSC